MFNWDICSSHPDQGPLPLTPYTHPYKGRELSFPVSAAVAMEGPVITPVLRPFVACPSPLF